MLRRRRFPTRAAPPFNSPHGRSHRGGRILSIPGSGVFIWRSYSRPHPELGEVLAALAGYIARKTREDIIRRTTAGREPAKANGFKFGRKPKLSPAQRRPALAHRAAGESQSAIARSYQVSCSTISKLEQDRATTNSMISGASARGAGSA